MTLSPTTYTYRRRARIPPFTEGCIPSPGLARNDKIKVIFTGTISYGYLNVLDQHLREIDQSGDLFTLDNPRFPNPHFAGCPRTTIWRFPAMSSSSSATTMRR
jgi:hypothetical protein